MLYLIELCVHLRECLLCLLECSIKSNYIHLLNGVFQLYILTDFLFTYYLHHCEKGMDVFGDNCRSFYFSFQSFQFCVVWVRTLFSRAVILGLLSFCWIDTFIVVVLSCVIPGDSLSKRSPFSSLIYGAGFTLVSVSMEALFHPSILSPPVSLRLRRTQCV